MKKDDPQTTGRAGNEKTASSSAPPTETPAPSSAGPASAGGSGASGGRGTSKLALAALSSVPLLMVLGNSMLIPEFPTIKSQLQISQFQVGLLITLFSAAAGAAIPILGFLSDQYGRKVIIIPSVILYGIGGVISGLGALFSGGSYPLILAGRVVQGLGAAGTAPIVMAMVGDLYKSNARSAAMGVIEASNGMGKVLSPILGALVALITWWALFFSYAILAIPIALAVYFLTTEPPRGGEKQTITTYFQQIVQIFREKGGSLLVTPFAGMAVLFILFGILSYVSDVLEQDYHLKGLVKGLVIAIPIFFMSACSFLTGRFLKQQGRFFKLSILVGLILEGTALFFLPFFDNPYIFIGILTLMGLSGGFVLPAVNTLVTSAAASQQRGGITSLYNSVRFIGVAVGPPVFCLLNDHFNEKMMFWFGTVIAFLAAGLIILLLKEEKLAPKGSGQDRQERSTTASRGLEEEREGFLHRNKLR